MALLERILETTKLDGELPFSSPRTYPTMERIVST